MWSLVSIEQQSPRRPCDSKRLFQRKYVARWREMGCYHRNNIGTSSRKHSSRMRTARLLTAGVCVRGVVCVWGCTSLDPEEHLQTQRHTPPANRMTDWCKNIAFPQLRLRTVINILIFVRSSVTSNFWTIWFSIYLPRWTIWNLTSYIQTIWILVHSSGWVSGSGCKFLSYILIRYNWTWHTIPNTITCNPYCHRNQEDNAKHYVISWICEEFTRTGLFSARLTLITLIHTPGRACVQSLVWKRCAYSWIMPGVTFPNTPCTIAPLSYYRPQRSWAKVIFSQACVKNSVHSGECLPRCMLGYTNPPGPDPPPGSRLQHTVNERPVRILLECILVWEYLRKFTGF